ncbi:RNase H domain-containing protein [Trichonephila clavipes]|nr:RNase H domain-containing protein [Trichonephila clavipes]
MSVLEALKNYHDRCHPVARASGQRGKVGNDPSAARSSPLSDMKRVILHHIFQIWQESWSQQLDNKLHSVKPVIGACSVMPMRRTDVIQLTSSLSLALKAHTRFTHRHLLFGERALNVLHAMSLTLFITF